MECNHEPEFPPDAEVDPRVEDELDKMNVVAQQLNDMETHLEAARNKFRQLLTDTAHRLDELQKQLGGSCVELARPYYEARRQAKLIQAETQAAALRYERACEKLLTAKEMVRTTEQACCTSTDVAGRKVDETWAMMLNQATEKVSEAECCKVVAAKEHSQLLNRLQLAQDSVMYYERDLKRPIKKSRKYFEVNARCQLGLQEQKQHVEVYEEKVKICKRLYEEALKTLESISEEIHAKRNEETQLRKTLGERGQGVGAEDPPSLVVESCVDRSDKDPPDLVVESCVPPQEIAHPVPTRRKSQSNKSLRSSLAVPIMSLLQDTMKEHAKENARMEEQRKQMNGSPAMSVSSTCSLDDETIAEYAVSNTSIVVEGGETDTTQHTLHLAPELRRILQQSSSIS